MDILKNIVKAPFSLIAKGIKAEKNMLFPSVETSPIIAVARTDHPQAYEYYFSDNDVSRFKGFTVVWRKGISEKEKSKTLEELKQVV